MPKFGPKCPPIFVRRMKSASLISAERVSSSPSESFFTSSGPFIPFKISYIRLLPLLLFLYNRNYIFTPIYLQLYIYTRTAYRSRILRLLRDFSLNFQISRKSRKKGVKTTCLSQNISFYRLIGQLTHLIVSKKASLSGSPLNYFFTILSISSILFSISETSLN